MIKNILQPSKISIFYWGYTYYPFFAFIVFLALVMQPVFQGIEVSGRNIIRLTTLGYIPIIILLSHITYPKKINFLSNIFLLLVLFIWSCHPTFSKFNFLENFKF